MSNYIFIFDLDSTITEKEILPTISEYIGKKSEMRELTEATMRGEIPFKTSFLRRVDILKTVKVSKVNEIVSKVPISKHIAEFIKENSERCFVVTGNLDIWIRGLMEKIGIENHVYCSKADVCDDYITQVISVADKELMVQQFVQPLVIVGDGDNDSGMASLADIAIGYGGVRDIAPSLLNNINYAFYNDKKLVEFLNKLL